VFVVVLVRQFAFSCRVEPLDIGNGLTFFAGYFVAYLFKTIAQVGKNLHVLSQLDGVDLEMYKDVVLPRVLEQVLRIFSF